VQTLNMKRNDSCPYLSENSSVYVTPETKAKSQSLDRKSHIGIKPANQSASAIKSLFMNLKYQESDSRSDTSDSRMSSKFYVKSHTPSLASSQEESVADSFKLQFEELKEEFNAQIKDLIIKLGEEKRRNICLEEQIQYLTDLHQKDMQSLKSEFEVREEKYDFQQDERFDEIQAEIRERDERLNYQSDQKLMELRNDLQAMETKLNTLQHHQVYNMDIAQICFHHFFTKNYVKSTCHSVEKREILSHQKIFREINSLVT